MVTGKGVEVKYRMQAPIIVIPFKTDFGEFVLEANLADK